MAGVVECSLLVVFSTKSGKRKMTTYYLCSSLSLRGKQVFTFPKISLLSVKWNFSSFFFFFRRGHPNADHTSDYADIHILGKQMYAHLDGSWDPTSSEGIRKFVAFLPYMGLVRVGSYELYWSTASFYYGL